MTYDPSKEIQAISDASRLRRKADQYHELASLAYRDGDHIDGERNTKLARECEAKLREVLA